MEVQHWEIVDVNGATMRETCRNVMGMLEARPWVWSDPAVHVVVEQQTQTNAPMRVLQHVIQVLVDQRRQLAGLGASAPPVALIPARSKYDMVGGAIKGGYAANKRNSVAFARACEGLTPSSWPCSRPTEERRPVGRPHAGRLVRPPPGARGRRRRGGQSRGGGGEEGGLQGQGRGAKAQARAQAAEAKAQARAQAAEAKAQARAQAAEPAAAPSSAADDRARFEAESQAGRAGDRERRS